MNAQVTDAEDRVRSPLYEYERKLRRGGKVQGIGVGKARGCKQADSIVGQILGKKFRRWNLAQKNYLQFK